MANQLKYIIGIFFFAIALISCSDKETEILKMEYATIIWCTDYNRSYVRTFYRKTRKTTQAYKEDNYLSASGWLDESEDNILVRFSWETYDDGIKVSYSYYDNNDPKNDRSGNISNASDDQFR